MTQQPAENRILSIDGHHLTLSDVVHVARHQQQVVIHQDAIKAMQTSRQVVEDIIREDKPAYGINTGFGDFSKVSISEEDSSALQNNLILSHCTGVGEPFPEEVVRAMLLLRANALCGGFSGIRPVLVQGLVDMLNAGVHPVVPEKGSLGASGDLAPLSHMVLPLLGKGEAFYQGKRMPGGEAMRMAGLQTFSLLAKEGLALINGTQAMTAVGSLAVYDAVEAAKLADIVASMTFEALHGLLNAYDERVHTVRPHSGQLKVARNLRMLCENSPLLSACQQERVQDAYALRCIPQVHGAARNALKHIVDVLQTELNAVTDNPLIFPEDHQVISGGNFHGEPMAMIFDYLGIAAAELASISERRLERMVNAALSNGLPPFLVKKGGLNSGFMIVQYAAAALVSENKVLAHPACVDSIPSSANQEDHVSMGTIAARKGRDIIQNMLSVLAMELMCACQALDLRGQTASPVHEAIRAYVRSLVDMYDMDREIHWDITRMNEIVRGGEVQSIALSFCPEFN